VSVGGAGLPGVTVELLDEAGTPIVDVDSKITAADGKYNFSSVPPGSYQVAMFGPMGYASEDNPRGVTLEEGQTALVDFVLTQSVTTNNARTSGYWADQFAPLVVVIKRPKAVETSLDLQRYISAVHSHYTPHFSHFAGVMTFSEWYAVLNLPQKPLIPQAAKAELAALVLNLASLKIGQYTAVTADLVPRTAGDVLTYASTLFSNSNIEIQAKAGLLAGMVNTRRRIKAGIVPAGNILYKTGEQVTTGEVEAPKEFALFQNHPNPFNPSTTIRYALPQRSLIALSVFNTLGQHVAQLVNGDMEAGYYEVKFDATGLPSGMYFYRMQAGTFVETRKLLLVR
jgi:hypothetical protein